MKAIRVDALSSDRYTIAEFELPAAYRSGLVETRNCRHSASGDAPRTKPKLMPAESLRTIKLPEGEFTPFAGRSGALLTFVASGELTLALPGRSKLRLASGDVLLTDESSAANLAAWADRFVHLLQIGVAPDWPGDAPGSQVAATLIPRRGSVPKIKRIYRGEDRRFRFAEFPELFSAPLGEWSAPRPIVGFKIMCWEDGDWDWRPGVIDQLAIILSGEMQVEVGGKGGSIEIFRAGDICLGEHRASEGHLNRVLGATYLCALFMETPDLW
jgi:hypothetical protein